MQIMEQYEVLFSMYELYMDMQKILSHIPA